MATTIAAEVHMHRLLASLIGITSVSLALHVSSAAAHGTLDGYEISEALETFLHAVDPKAVLQPAQTVDCTLSGGTKAKCAKFVLQPKPKRTGPWCPDYVSDGPEVGGFWIKDGEVFDVDGAFVKNLAEFYKNPSSCWVTITVVGPPASTQSGIWRDCPKAIQAAFSPTGSR